ncbi:hypothetical protein KC339_g38 [Hortaea werneckii]|nr:hypothetical protein KC339_g38 [Hortaea werneckii]
MTIAGGGKGQTIDRLALGRAGLPCSFFHPFFSISVWVAAFSRYYLLPRQRLAATCSGLRRRGSDVAPSFCHAAEDPPGNHLRQVAESLQTRGFGNHCTAHPAIARSTNITASLPGETYGMDPLVTQITTTCFLEVRNRLRNTGNAELACAELYEFPCNLDQKNMHQHIRSAPRSSSAASNPSTNPERTNNRREPPPQRTRSSVDLASYTERGAGTDASNGGQKGQGAGPSAGPAGSGQDKELNKLNQIIQHFHTKAALMICAARMNLPPSLTKAGEIRQDRWRTRSECPFHSSLFIFSDLGRALKCCGIVCSMRFAMILSLHCVLAMALPPVFNIVVDDTDVLLEDLREWKRPDVSDNKPPPLVVEVYIDTANLRENQALVITDDDGKRWDVSDALAGSTESSPRPPTRNGRKHCEVVLERWTIELGGADGLTPGQLNEQLPNVYKKGVVLFRSLHTYLRFTPAWKLYRRVGRQPGNSHGLKLKCRIKQGRDLPHGQKDLLATPLCPSDADSSTSSFSDTTTNTESQNRTTSEHAFPPLRCPSGLLRIGVTYRRNQDFASLRRLLIIIITSHGTKEYDGKTAKGVTRGLWQLRHLSRDRKESPLSALQHQQNVSDTSSEDGETSDMEGAPKLKEDEYRQRAKEHRKSTMPPPNVFKAGSLGTSPLFSQSQQVAHSAPVSRQPVANDAYQPLLLSGNYPNQMDRRAYDPKSDDATYSPADGYHSTHCRNRRHVPAPASRFTSAFSNRPRRPGSVNSGGRSGESGDGSSSDARESTIKSRENTDDSTDIQSYISLLSSPEVTSHALRRPATTVHQVDLGRYRNMREGSATLADDMASSVTWSGTPPSRRLSNVPGLSTSSSPGSRGGMAYAPHVRSRLSTQSIGAGPEEEGAQPQQQQQQQQEEEEPCFFPAEEIPKSVPYISWLFVTFQRHSMVASYYKGNISSQKAIASLVSIILSLNTEQATCSLIGSCRPYTVC